jgi:hypothetical protein
MATERRAQIVDGVVVNVAEVLVGAVPEAMADWPVTAEAGPGWTYDGETFSPPVVVTPVPASITFRQLLIGLVAEGWITEAEGDAWLIGTIPAAASALVASLPAGAEVRCAGQHHPTLRHSSRRPAGRGARSGGE